MRNPCLTVRVSASDWISGGLRCSRSPSFPSLCFRQDDPSVPDVLHPLRRPRQQQTHGEEQSCSQRGSSQPAPARRQQELRLRPRGFSGPGGGQNLRPAPPGGEQTEAEVSRREENLLSSAECVRGQSFCCRNIRGRRYGRYRTTC